MKVGEPIWSYAWDVATLGHAPATKFDEHTAGLAIVGPSQRAQHQVRVRAMKTPQHCRRPVCVLHSHKWAAVCYLKTLQTGLEQLQVLIMQDQTDGYY